MPYKKGPNNTLRYYSSTTGKYIKDPGQLEFSNSCKCQLKNVDLWPLKM